MRWIGLVAVMAAGGAHAQTQDPATPAADGSVVAGTGASQGVIVYPPSFFAASQPTSAFDMIQRVPGFTFEGGDNQVRGYAGAIGNVIIDGAPPSSKSEALEEVVKRISASSVERIELIRGGAPGIDMRGRSVLVNVVRKTNTARTGLMAVASGVTTDGRASPAVRLEGSIRSGGRSVEGSVLAYKFLDDGAGEGPRVRTDANGRVIAEAFHDQTAGGMGVQFKTAARSPVGPGELRLNGALTLETYQFNFLDDQSTPVPVLSENDDNFDRIEGEAGFNYDLRFGPRWSLETLGLQRLKSTSFVSSYVEPGFNALFTEEADSGESILRSTLKFRKSDAWSFEAGGEVAFNFLESAVTYAENATPVVLPASNVRVEELRAEGFGQATWRISPKWTLEAGARIETSTISQSGDSNTEQSFVYPKPRVLLTWAPSQENQLRVRFEREVGQLDFGDYVSSSSFSTGTIDAGNPDLHPDQTWVSEVAYERRFWGKGAMVATYRYKMITDAVDRVPVFQDTDRNGVPDDIDGDGFGDTFDAPGNIGDATMHEFALDMTIPLDRLGVRGGQLKGQGTWRSSRVTDPTTGEERRLSEVLPFETELHFTQDIPSRKMNWGINLFAGHTETYYRFNEVRTYKLDPWLTMFVEFKPQPGLSVFFEASNLLSREFDVTREVYGGPRDTAALAFIETRPLKYPPFLYMRLRRTFG